MKIYTNCLDHMTTMAATPIYGKKLSKIFFLRTCGPIAMELGMYHWGCRAIIVCSNYDPRLTLIYITPRSRLVT